jgi:hypothetical protein
MVQRIEGKERDPKKGTRLPDCDDWKGERRMGKTSRNHAMASGFEAFIEVAWGLGTTLVVSPSQSRQT